jgi:peptide/nickel transport system permease protein
MIWLRSFSTFTLTVVGAFSIGYMLINYLPSAAFAALGIFASNEAVVSDFLKHQGTKDYLQYVTAALSGDLGFSLDGLPVGNQVLQAAMVSLPILLIALTIVSIALYKAVYAKDMSFYTSLLGYCSFLPVYVFGMIAGVLVLLIPSGGNLATSIIAGIAISISVGALLVRQMQNVIHELMRSDHVRFHRAQGASDRQVRKRISRNVFVQLLPSVQSAVLVCIASVVFVELILGIGGIGSLTARAIRRSDTNLILGLILVLSFMTGILQMLSDWIFHLVNRGER